MLNHKLNKMIKMTSAVLTLILVNFTITASAEILRTRNERWKAPCGSQKELITKIRDSLKKAIEVTNQTKCAFARDRNLNQDMMNCVDAGYSHIMEIPTDTETHPNIIAKHQGAYKFLSIAAIYIEQVKINETIYQETHDDALTGNIEDIENTVYQILCFIQSDLAQSKSYILRHQSRDIMADNVRSITSPLARLNRDYMILNDVVIILEKFLNVYIDILVAIS